MRDRTDRHERRRHERAAPRPRRRPQEPVQSPIDRSFELEPVHHRWLLTTCVAGIAGTLLVGSAVLGIFGENAAPRDAHAAVAKSSMIGADDLDAGQSAEGVKELSSAYQPLASTQDSIVPERDLNNDNNYPEISAEDLPYGDGKTMVLDAEIEAANSEENITTITKMVPPEPVDESFKLAKGETLVDALVDRGVSTEAAQALVAAIEPVFPATLIKAGTAFELTLDAQQDFYGRYITYPVELSFQPGPKETIKIQSDEDGRFVAMIDGAKDGAKSRYAQSDYFRVEAKVGSSLYAAAKDNGIPDNIMTEFTRVFAYDVDFQRQVKPEDTFEVFYGNPLTGSSSKRKVLYYAQLTLAGKTKTYFRYTAADGRADYYDERGRSASKSLLKTPVAGARLTSGFGMRRHPILGYNKMHTGLDFGLPYGTPLRAAGEGIVTKAGRAGAYGIVVQINHSKTTATMFAHMSKLAPGIRSGTKVRQGQVVGYVGSTGRSTGPHAHYEVRINGRPVNPAQMKSSGGKQLSGKELAKFKQLKQRVYAMMQQAPSALQVAQAQP